MAIRYKVLCARCKKNYVTVTWKQKYIACYDCQKDELHKEIKNAEMRKLFDIPEQFYKDHIFLRNIKMNYIRFGQLSTKQIAAFKKAIKELKEASK
ncbi:hypothetical protein J4468_04170 [Candidatus Woesearchaeota archaeon]|nr:hypothetical protein [Candidatus Woesearchaeota archaeon]